MDINKLCIHCMNEIDVGAGGVCPHCGHIMGKFPELNHQLRPMTILRGKYLTGDVLGEGGFGITYIGLDLNLELKVAIKEFYPNGYATRESASTSALTIYGGQYENAVHKWRDSFIKEGRSLAKCAHLPGVVEVRDFFEENNTAYLVMEYVEGVTLKEYAGSKGGRIPAYELLPAMDPVFAALGEVHKEGLIHRDISPDNIMLLPGGKMKLLDFGAAREYTADEKSLSVMLKPGYAPEEQYRTRGKQGPWSDIYALAGTIYKCLTGVTPPEAMERMRQDELSRPNSLGAGLSAGQEEALLKAMAVHAEERYQTIADFRMDFYKDAVGWPPVQDSTYSNSAVMPVEQSISIPVPKQNNTATNLNERNNNKSIVTGAIIAGCLLIVSIIFIGTKNGDRKQLSRTVQPVDNNTQAWEDASENPASPESAEPPVSDDATTAETDDMTYAESGVAEEAPAEELPAEDGIPEEYRQAYEAIMSRFAIDESTAGRNFIMKNDNFSINSQTMPNYYQDMNYQYYDPGIADFTFFYPTDLYNVVIYGDNFDMTFTENYGTMLQYINFLGTDGSELLFCAIRREDTMSLEDMTNYVYLMESQQMLDPEKLIFVSNDDNDHGRVIVTGYSRDRSMLIYDLFKIEHQYVFQMKVIFPQFTDDYDKKAKDYYTECVYRLCGFSGSTKEIRSFAEYMEAAAQ